MDAQSRIQRGGILLLLSRHRAADSLYAAPEVSVALFVEDQPVTTWRCSPSRLSELAAGWLLVEGVIASPAEILDIDQREIRAAHTTIDAPTVRIDVRLAEGTPERLEESRRHPIPHSIAGRSATSVDWLESDWRQLYERMYAHAPLRAAGGGVHTGALVRDRELIALEEDVGRHNVVDKLVGRAMMEELQLAGSVLLLSGRLSGSIAAKASRAGLAGLISLSIPTTLAVRIATRSGLTLVGRARRGTPLVYSPHTASPDEERRSESEEA
ncbi:MAG: formate dehydrogenase accessory sulfurtransferase FdhD [Gemmatimonadota bacterium]